MELHSFINNVRNLEPDLTLLKKRNWPEEIENSIIAAFKLKEKKSSKEHSNPLLNFVAHYELKHLDYLTGLSFSTSIIKKDHFSFWGNIELEHLVVDHRDGKVKFLEWDESKVIDEIAIDSHTFLDVLLAKITRAQQTILGDKKSPCKDAENLARLSGVPTSINFYKRLLGCHVM